MNDFREAVIAAAKDWGGGTLIIGVDKYRNILSDPPEDSGIPMILDRAAQDEYLITEGQVAFRQGTGKTAEAEIGALDIMTFTPNPTIDDISVRIQDRLLEK